MEKEMKKEIKEFHLLVISELIVLISLIIFVLIYEVTLTGFVIYESAQNATTINDTYLREGSPNNNYGSAINLIVGNISAGTEYNSLILDYNISSIPSSNTVTDAKLQVYVNTTSTNNITVKAYRIISQWNELQATWNNRTTSVAWSSAGGDYGEELDSVEFSNVSSQFYNFSITSAARGWVNGSYNNFGIIFVPSSSPAGSFVYLDSSNALNNLTKPKFIIDYTANAIPIITNISTDSSLTAPKNVAQQVNISVNWTDLESNLGKLFVCNSSSINISGCGSGIFCNTSSDSSYSSCLYTINSSNNRTTSFWAAVCDSSNCSTANQSFFYMNHFPVALVIAPNGGETVNQSLGNYSIRFNVSDSDSDLLNASIYYGATQNSTTNLIVSNLNLTQRCTDLDSLTSTTNNCSYSWNSSGIYGSYFLTIITDDSFARGNDSSDSSFNVRSISDSTPPNITAQWIESNIYSGKIIQIRANVSEPNINTVWVSINRTQTNLTMRNTSATEFNVSWTAVSVGEYQFKVYANDTLGNLNNSMPWQSFNISKPNATTQNETVPSSALPYSTIKISGILNASDSLRGVYAYLNAPDSFTFISNYSQNLSLGNFSSNQTKTAIWIVSTPIRESTYSLNISYTDYYGNVWNSSNFQVQISSGIGGYILNIAGYPEVETSRTYYVEADFSQAGTYTAPDSILISIYDAIGSLTVGPASMSQESTGNYNYSYTVGASVNEGQWETIINATKSSVSYYVNHFWKVVGGPFDVRNIQIINSNINNLNISVLAENTGGANKDLILTWNLTREDNRELLNSGSDTFMVAANSNRTHYITPTTTYAGRVRITFLGYYSGTEKAGAYKIFTTTGEVSATTPSGGGGGGVDITPKEEKAELNIIAEKIIYLTSGLEKTIFLEIENTGEKTLTNIELTLENLNKNFYKVYPLLISSLKPVEKEKFQITFLITKDGEYNFNYLIKSNEITKRESGKIILLGIREYLLKEVERIENKIKKLEITDIGKLKECEYILMEIKLNIEKEEFINAKDNLIKAENCVDNLKLKEVPLKILKMEPVILIILILLIILIVMLILIIITLYRKFSVFAFLKSKHPQEIKSPKKDSFAERIERIERKLNE